MATTVNGAFSEFLDKEINIWKGDSDLAKTSRDYLYNQIHNISSKGGFIPLASSYDVSFGSFSRKTKISPLDDIDIIIGLDGKNTTFCKRSWDDIEMQVDENSANTALKKLCDNKGYYGNIYVINSNRVKNKLVSELSKINNYSKAELHARGEAVTLNLKSYSWNFDIVPAFYCNYDSKEFYLIPNGKGNWKFTNPKLEQERVSKLNVKFNNTVLSTIRLLKYWNKRGRMPNFTSYVLETVTLDYFDQTSHSIHATDGKDYDYSDMHFSEALNYISNHILGSIQDTKGIQSNINDLDMNARLSIYKRAKSDYEKSKIAIYAEINEKDHKKSISIWRDIFGERFPKYE